MPNYLTRKDNTYYFRQAVLLNFAGFSTGAKSKNRWAMITLL